MDNSLDLFSIFRFLASSLSTLKITTKAFLVAQLVAKVHYRLMRDDES